MSFSNIGIAERCSFAKGDHIDGKYYIDGFLGEGTFGQVFRVKDASGKVYALKLLKLWEVMASERPNLLKRFEREYETGQIKSNYLVHSVGKGIIKGNAYIVMEYCASGDLNNGIKNLQIDLPSLMSHVLLGLRDLHQNGKVHRDLKPENVLLRDTNHAVLTDFGIAGDQNNRLTSFGWKGVPQQRFGTIAYMPPEQINPKRGNATVLPTTDIFSFGVMTYQLLTQCLPFGDLRTEADVPLYIYNGKEGNWDRTAILNKPKGQEWVTMIEGCLEPDFKKRFQTIDDVLKNLPSSKNGIHKNSSLNTPKYKKDTTNGLLLRVMQGEELGKVYFLNSYFRDNSSILYIGRQSHDIWNHIEIKEDESSYISRQHCTIEKDNISNIWIIRDGQFRVTCANGKIREDIFPCMKCNEYCSVEKKRRIQQRASLNGTFVNSHEVGSSGLIIKPGDIISIGDVKMRVEGV